jgi:leader peptidase (prepilin peptidase)/N-methyltransferase
LAVIDWRHLMLPDVLTLPLIPAGIAAAWALAPDRLADHVIGAAAGFAFLALVAVLYRRFRGRHGIGLGDGKLFAAAGAWVGWQGLPSVLLLAAFAGLAGALVQARLAGGLDPERELPFGLYLAGALWLVWLYGPLGLG